MGGGGRRGRGPIGEPGWPMSLFGGLRRPSSGSLCTARTLRHSRGASEHRIRALLRRRFGCSAVQRGQGLSLLRHRTRGLCAQERQRCARTGRRASQHLQPPLPALYSLSARLWVKWNRRGLVAARCSLSSLSPWQTTEHPLPSALRPDQRHGPTGTRRVSGRKGKRLDHGLLPAMWPLQSKWVFITLSEMSLGWGSRCLRKQKFCCYTTTVCLFVWKAILTQGETTTSP